MQFFDSSALAFLWLIPLVVSLSVLSRRLWEKRLRRFGDLETLRRKLMPAFRPTFKMRAFLAALVFLCAILALARPQWGEEKKRIERKGVNMLFLLDTSLSMLAEDVKPNRLEKSKLEIKTFIRKLKGDRVGMVAFSGSSFLQSPLTLDYTAFLLFLDAIKTGYIPDPGTSLERAIHLAIRSFPEKELKYKSVILFSDGEDHEGGIEQALEEAKKAGVRIYAVGVGTVEGEPIPLRDEEGRKSGFKKDASGQLVVTKLNPTLLEKIANETGGLYLPGTPGEQEVDIILKHQEGLGEKRFRERLVSEKEDHFQFFLFWAVIFLALEMLVRRQRKNLATALSLLAAFLVFSGFLESPRDLNEKGNELFQEKKYQSALDSYRRAGTRRPEDPTILYNLGSTLYKVNEYQEASQSLEKTLGQAKDRALLAQAHYNYGNVQYRLGNFEKAIEAYQKALEINPKDVDAKYNLEFLQKQKSLFEKKDQEHKKNQQQQQKQQQQQQQKQQPQDQKQQQDQESGQGKEQDQQKREEEESQAPSEPQKEEDQQQQREKEQSQAQKEEQGREEEQRRQEEEKEEREKQEEREEEQGQAPKPLQGQMTLENALQILDALKDSEKELQDIRRPPVPKEPPPVAKDW